MLPYLALPRMRFAVPSVLPRPRWALTPTLLAHRRPALRRATISPLPDPHLLTQERDFAALRRQGRGGHRRYLSVALSVASRRPAVSRHPALWGPDFPRHVAVPRLPGGLPVRIVVVCAVGSGRFPGYSLPFLLGTKEKTPPLGRNEPMNSPASSGSSLNCWKRQSRVSATYQLLPWLRMNAPGSTR